MNVTIEPDRGGPDQFRRKVTKTERVPNTRASYMVTLECEHVVQTFGPLERAPVAGLICTRCRDDAQRK